MQREISKPRQVRKEATVGGQTRVTWGSLTSLYINLLTTVSCNLVGNFVSYFNSIQLNVILDGISFVFQG
jgi:hypothetical protein